MILEAIGTLNSQDPAVGQNGYVMPIPCEGKFGAASFQITGTWAGQIEFEISNDGVNYVSLNAAKTDGTSSATHATANGMWLANIASAKYVQARMSTFTSGVAAVFMTVSITPASGTSSGGGGGGGGAATIADGADVAEGATTDVAVVGDNAGTVSAKLRGLSKILNDVWDSVNHWLKVSIQNTTLAVTQSGSWVLSAGSAVIGHVITDTGSTTAVTGNVTAVQPTGTNLHTVIDSGTLTAVTAITNALPAGSALLGKVGIDQTTPGTTNAIAGDVAAAATDGSNPVKIGGKAASTAPTAVTAGQRVNALFDLWGRLFVRNGAQSPVASTFTAVHVPATAVQATVTKASAGSGKRNVCTGFTVTLAAGAAAIAAAAPLIVSVIDGASGGTTYLWRSYVNIPATAGVQVSIVRSNMWLVGSQATALTVEFSAAGGTNSYESVAIDGVIVEE